MTHDHHDTVVVEDRGGSGMGAVLGILGIIVLLVAVWYFALGPGANPTTNSGTDTPAATEPAIDLPSVAPEPSA